MENNTYDVFTKYFFPFFCELKKLRHATVKNCRVFFLQIKSLIFIDKELNVYYNSNTKNVL